MKTIFRIIKHTTVIALLLIASYAIADDLSNQLKSFHTKLAPEVEKILVYYADNNAYLNSLEMRQAAYIASKVDEWEIAGFYYIAQPMIFEISQKSVEYDSPLEAKGMKSLRKYWKQLDKRLKPLKKIKLFKELKNFNNVDLAKVNKSIRLKLMNHIPLLKGSLALYELWHPIINKDYHHISSFNNIKSEYEINALFKQHNEIYVKANQDFIKLLAIPRYKELKLLSDNGMGAMIEKLESGKLDFIQLKKNPKFMQKMMTYGNNKREMEQLEIDNLLFPEIAWGSWY